MNCPKPVLYFPVFKKIKSIGEIFVESVDMVIDKKSSGYFVRSLRRQASTLAFVILSEAKDLLNELHALLHERRLVPKQILRFAQDDKCRWGSGKHYLPTDDFK